MTNQSTPTYTLMMDGCALYKNLTAKQALELYYHECMYHPRLTFYVKSEIDGEQVSLLQLEEVSEAPNQNHHYIRIKPH